MTPAEFYRWDGEQWECSHDDKTWSLSSWLEGCDEKEGLREIEKWGHINVREAPEVAA